MTCLLDSGLASVRAANWSLSATMDWTAGLLTVVRSIERVLIRLQVDQARILLSRLRGDQMVGVTRSTPSHTEQVVEGVLVVQGPLLEDGSFERADILVAEEGDDLVEGDKESVDQVVGDHQD